MCQLIYNNGEMKSDIKIRNSIYELDGYFTISELITLLERNNLSFESKYISQIIDEMLSYNNIEKRGVYFKAIL